ncbi:MAG: FAD-dependent oxidoreductase [Clostridiales bacterium]|nr:FAD-dependent oxidoreductase [Clostridiales bacterium]
MNKEKSIFSPIKAWKYLLRKPITVPKKDIFDKPREASLRYRGFHQNDWEKCLGCGTCSRICPTNAITMIEVDTLEEKEGYKNERPAFDYGRCTYCALCVDICPSDSLYMSREYMHISKDADTFYILPDSTGIHGDSFKKGYVRDSDSELLDLNRYEMELEPVGRKNSFMEIVRGFSLEKALGESARCVECGICTEACPANMNIPEYIKSVWEGDMRGAVGYLYKTNPLANVCGRICTHNCENVCALGHRGEAISIRWLKRFIVDNTPMDEYEEAALEFVTEAVNGKVAIVGSGPSGLSCAYYLRTLGYEVDVYEEKELPGGVIRYGGPEYRLPEKSVLKDISMIEKSGVNFICNTKVGRDVQLDELHNKYDAVFIGTGFSLSRPLKIPGYEHEDVEYAIPFLGQTRDYLRETAQMPAIHEKVAVIGGGNVAFDVARTMIRLQQLKYGADSVSMASLEHREILPCDIEELEEGTEEGIKGYFGYGPDEIIIENGKITGLRVKKVLSIFDEAGKFNPKYDEADKFVIEATQVYIATGQMPEYAFFDEAMLEQVEIARGKVKVGKHGQFSSFPWLFAGGDIVQGPDIITGVANGHDAADGIDIYIRAKNK